ncbi:MAG: HlyD family efflux transporter periplasmic adaptor subunit [Geobacter sp.]|nr:HlyD family efflux transporter periplasmic adaptor subunit [Geobacter sp.]
MSDPHHPDAAPDVTPEPSPGTGEPVASQQAAPPKPPASGRMAKAAVILLLLGIVFVSLGIHWWIRHQTHIETDNAFVEAHIHPIAARIPGTVTRVLVNDNQQVRKGDLLVEIDQADYRIQVDKANADVAVARNESDGDNSEVGVSRAAVQQARAQLDQARLDLERGKNLFAREVIPREQLDRLETAGRVAAARLAEAEDKLRKALAIAGPSDGRSRAKVRQKEADLADARLKLSYTRIYAPTDGHITRKTVEQGNIVQPGQPLMALVPLRDAWVVANYKESQLTYIRPGQQVEFRVDTYPGKRFTGTVDSIMAGTGAAFSLLPPENASGNYVKVVQRIPVKIAINPSSDPEQVLRVGMSVVPTVLVERKVADILRDLLPF